jgi:hypothetical protein
MAFQKVDKGSWQSNADNLPSVRMSAHLADSTSVRSVVFFITRRVLDDVGAPIDEENRGSIKKRTRMAVYEGTGTDEGFLLITPDPKGYSCTLSAHGAHTFSMSVAISKLRHYVLNECPAPVCDVEFTIDEKEHSILVQCPDWLRFNVETRTRLIEGPKVDVVEMRGRRRRVG